MTTAPSHPPSASWGSIMMILVAGIVVQVGAALAKQLFPVIGPEGTASLRLLIAALILSILWRPWKARLSQAQWISILMYGLSLGGMNLMIYQAFSRIPLGIAVALEFSGPLAVALFTSRGRWDFLWVILAVSGILLLLPVSEASQGMDWVGTLFALGAGLCWALYIVFGQKSSASIHGGTAAALGMIVGTLLVLPFGWAVNGENLFKESLMPVAFGVAILSSVIPYSLEIIALKNVPMKTFGILMSLGPAMGALAGFLFLNETLDGLQCLAITCIIAASVGSTLGMKAAKEVPKPVP